MKILYISQSEIPSISANSIHVMKMCSSISKIKNCEVDLFCLKSLTLSNQSLDDIFKFYLVKKTFNLLILNVFKFWIFKEFQTLLFILYRLFKKKYDLIYSRSIQISWFLSIFGNSTVLELHSPPSKKTLYFLKYLLKKNKIKKLIVINQALKRYFKNHYNLNKNLIIEVHPDASDKHYLNKRTINKTKIKNNSVGYLGHLYQGRGIDLIIKLAKHLPKNNFYIVGGTRSHLETWKQQIKSDNIFFLGFKDQLECNYLRKKFDYLIAPYQSKVFVHGSINPKTKNKTLETSKWMSPLKIFEYMSSRKPIISSNLKSIKEILTHNQDAILCDPNNFFEWKNAIIKLNNNKNFAKKISTNAYKKFLNNFTWDLRAKKILEEYENLKITIFNFSLSGGGTEYMLSVLYNKLSEIKKYKVNLLLCKKGGHYDNKIINKNNLIFLNKERVIFSITNLYKFLKNSKTKILITSMLHTNIVAIIIKLILFPKLKIIIRESNTISVKSYYDKSLKSKILNFLAKIFYKKADAIIAPTNVIKNDLIENYNVNSNLIHRIHNPYDFKEIKKLSKKNIYSKEKKLLRDKYLLSIGRLHPQKNFPFLIKIFKSIVSIKKFENFKLFIVGDGKDKNKLQKQINKFKLGKKIKLLGFQKNPFVFMKRCKLFILTSIYEGHSNVLIHSQYLNNKILSSSAFGANREVLSSNGTIYNSQDPKKVAKLAIKVLESKEKKISTTKLMDKYSDRIIISKFQKLFN